MALVATWAVPLTLFSQWFSFFVSTLEALNFQPFGLANPSAEGRGKMSGEMVNPPPTRMAVSGVWGHWGRGGRFRGSPPPGWPFPGDRESGPRPIASHAC